jgi:hypothetical protein
MTAMAASPHLFLLVAQISANENDISMLKSTKVMWKAILLELLSDFRSLGCHPLRPPKNTPKGRIFEPWYLHHNVVQLYEILYVSETDSVAILLYMTSACATVKYHCAVSSVLYGLVP